jgi:hypothetical protein
VIIQIEKMLGHQGLRRVVVRGRALYQGSASFGCKQEKPALAPKAKQVIFGMTWSWWEGEDGAESGQQSGLPKAQDRRPGHSMLSLQGLGWEGKSPAWPLGS